MDNAAEIASNNTTGIESEPATASIVSIAGDWLTNTRSRFRVVGELALAEAKLAALSIVLMAFLGTLSAVFVLAAWGLLVAGLAQGLMSLGLSLWIALTILAVLHLGGAFFLWYCAVRLSRHLDFPVTRQQLKPAADPESGDT